MTVCGGRAATFFKNVVHRHIVQIGECDSRLTQGQVFLKLIYPESLERCRPGYSNHSLDPRLQLEGQLERGNLLVAQEDSADIVAPGTRNGDFHTFAITISNA